ncbi:MULTISPECIES: Z-ring formation inhibitor MciZ [Heyndrickxia]|nr:Z-ring formation inhibitor MciZ [Heyndrickxia shackletonii]MBB2480928.1 Z-ring formation inhibitor MciZ [Bacillus sp. APMAM]NEZ00469.1 Z-ring formation inhibitor MciZ [Heyndrickxia shackletonii]RTZ55714.1 Z-ring formation inhibitor MciZ [Bacillus sp. SAJ1]
MKIFVHSKGITMSGKAWEIREQLKSYRKQYYYVLDWVKLINR